MFDEIKYPDDFILFSGKDLSDKEINDLLHGVSEDTLTVRTGNTLIDLGKSYDEFLEKWVIDRPITIYRHIASFMLKE